MREGGAAFGCLAKLATRRGSPLRPVAPQEDLQSSLPSLLQRILVPAERCKPPYSREWLLAHRARCGGSPLRPTAMHPTELLSLSASVAVPALDAKHSVGRLFTPLSTLQQLDLCNCNSNCKSKLGKARVVARSGHSLVGVGIDNTQRKLNGR